MLGEGRGVDTKAPHPRFHTDGSQISMTVERDSTALKTCRQRCARGQGNGDNEQHQRRRGAARRPNPRSAVSPDEGCTVAIMPHACSLWSLVAYILYRKSLRATVDCDVCIRSDSAAGARRSDTIGRRRLLLVCPIVCVCTPPVFLGPEPLSRVAGSRRSTHRGVTLRAPARGVAFRVLTRERRCLHTRQ